MNQKSYAESVISAIVPIRPRVSDVLNVGNWFSKPRAEGIAFILVLDRPTLEIENLIQSFMSEYPEIDIAVVKGNFGGPGAARNAALPLVKSRYLIFWDSDDNPRIDSVLDHLRDEKLSEGILSIGGFCLKEELKSDRIFIPSSLLEVACNPGLWRVVISSDLAKGIKFENLKLAEDQIFFLEVYLRSNKVELVPDVFYEYKYGFKEQLTSAKNYVDLCSAIARIYTLILRNRNSEKVKFAVDIFLKQVISLFLNGNWSTKRFAINSYIKLFIKAPKMVTQETSAVIAEMNRKRFK